MADIEPLVNEFYYGTLINLVITNVIGTLVINQ